MRAEKKDPTGALEGGLKPIARRNLALTLLALLIAVSASMRESTAFQSKRFSWLAQRAAEAKDVPRSLDNARKSLNRDPNETHALYLEAVKLKDMKEPKNANSKAELDSATERLLLIHPNQASVRRLAGEVAFRERSFEKASDLLWEAMWINPTPPNSAANYWRMTMMASFLAGKMDQAVAASARAISIADQDPLLKPQERRDLYMDVANVYEKKGWKLAAGYVREAMK